MIHDRKLDALEDLIEAANGKPVLVMYNYQHDLMRIQQRFGKYSPENPNGVRESEDRQRYGGLECGKGSRGGDTTRVHRARAESPAGRQHHRLVWVELVAGAVRASQCTAMAAGQKETVVVHHLVVKGTMDEQVMQALKDKAAGQDSLMRRYGRGSKRRRRPEHGEQKDAGKTQAGENAAASEKRSDPLRRR